MPHSFGDVCLLPISMSSQLLLVAVFIPWILCQEDSLDARRTNLAQLPLEKLLHVKQTLSSKHSNNKGETDEEDIQEETALPFRADLDGKGRNKPPTRRDDPWYEEKEGKDKDVSSIFQTTVTVLSFLAFGGYLLCLLCQSIKSQQTPTLPGVVTMIPTAAPAAIIGKKKRKKRSVEDSMIRTLHLIAEGYAKYSLAEE